MLLCCPALLSAQLQYTKWYFGQGAAIDFPNGGPPAPIPFSNMFAYGGSTSIADPVTGALLFYTNGWKIWDRTGSVMVNGDFLPGCYGEARCRTNAQPVIALRQPGHANQYVVFGSTREESVYGSTTRLGAIMPYTATHIDMSLNLGRGAVTVRGEEVWRKGTTQITAVRMCGRDGYWLIGHQPYDNQFVIWSFDSSGIGAPYTQSVGTAGNDLSDETGYLKASRDGSHIAYVANNSRVEVIAFDPVNGRLADTVAVTIRTDFGYGLSFSPDATKLYISETATICQYDITSNDSLTVARSRAIISARNASFGALQLAPDGKIYGILTYEPYLIVINNPDSAGDAAGFALRGAALGVPGFTGSLDLPNVVESELGLKHISADRASICIGDSVRLRSRWARDPRWSPSSTLTCSTCADPVAFPATTTTYYLVDNRTQQCGPLDSITVVVNPRPVPMIVGDTVLCSGESTELEVVTNGSVRWITTDGLSCTDCRLVIARPRVTTTYHFELTSLQGCVARDSIRVVVHPIPTASAGSDTTICAGAAVQLHASGGSRYQWSPAAGLSCVDCPDPIATPVAYTSYRVTVWNDAGCSASATMRINVVDSFTIDAGPDVSMCEGDVAPLRASGGAAYRWNASPDLSCLDCANPVARPSRSTTYYVTAQSTLGCTASDSIRVIVSPLPRVHISGDSIVCEGGTARLSVRGDGEFRWTSTGTIECAACEDIVVTPAATKTYYVEATSAEGCVRADSFTVTIVDRPSVTATGGEICAGGEITLLATGASAYTWDPPLGLSCTDCASPSARPPSTTTYTVIGTLPGGCSDTSVVTVVVNDPRLLVASMDRGITLLPGESRIMSVSMQESLVTDTLRLLMRWNPFVARIANVRAAPALAADGWTNSYENMIEGSYEVVLARSGAARIGSGDLLELDVTAFLGDSMSTEIPFTLSASASSCSFIDARPGLVQLDSICGLSFRLIEASEALLRLDAAFPNPVRDASIVRYVVPFDGIVTIALVDSRGAVTTLVNGVRSQGMHQVQIEARDLAPGVYNLQMRFGSIVRQTQVVVVK